MEMKRVLLKLSGEALAGDKKTGFDEATVKEVARQVKIAVSEASKSVLSSEAEISGGAVRVMPLTERKRIRLACWLLS